MKFDFPSSPSIQDDPNFSSADVDNVAGEGQTATSITNAVQSKLREMHPTEPLSRITAT